MRLVMCRPRSPKSTSSSGTSWVTHLIPRRWQPVQTVASAWVLLLNEQRILRRLHSQQLRVPFRSLRRLASDSASAVVGGARDVVASIWYETNAQRV